MPPKRVDQQSSDDMSSDASSEATLPLEETQENEMAAGGLQHGEMMANNPNDEAYMVNDAHVVATPPGSSDGKHSGTQEGKESTIAGGRLIGNNPNDEVVPVTDAEVVATPHKEERPPTPTDPGRREDIRLSSGTQPGAGEHGRHPAQLPERSEDDDDVEDDNEEEDEEDYRAHGYAGQQPDEIVQGGAPEQDNTAYNSLEYDPEEYREINSKASREIQDLFNHIRDFCPFVAELPTKLRPFIPDYIPAIGDLDPFVKIPRPDGRPDGLGLYVVDEPAIPQSNPAVVMLELRATNVYASGAANVVDSFEDAANRPEVIDRWIDDLKKVNYKKALPTVNYQKPMPDIENLMQVWPQSFEDVLNSDVQFPPPHIDLDIEQYIRTLCAILDIPTYQSLIDPLHVMFSLYEDFRFNQHFQHE
eukprot:gene5924-4237_t